MDRILLPFIMMYLLAGCKSPDERADFFGQTHPGSVPVVFAPGVVSKQGRLEQGISFTPNNREFAFGVLDNDEFNGEIHYSKKIGNRWADPSVFEPLQNESVYLPYFTPDGQALLYAQSKPDTTNVYTDIWMIEKTGDDWLSPRKLPAPLSSASREANASMAGNGTIYFSSNRNCDGKENCHTADLFYSRPTAGAYQSVAVIAEFFSSNDEESVFISPKEDYIIFCRYAGHETGVDLYISYRDIHDRWIAPQRVDSTINSPDWDRRPFVSADHAYLFFTRLQISESGLTESDIYWVNTSKLFKPFVYHPLADTTVRVGEPFELSIPEDYFRDIDDATLTYHVDQDKFGWLNVDRERMRITGIPPVEGNFELTFTAIDPSSNMTADTITITARKR